MHAIIIVTDETERFIIIINRTVLSVTAQYLFKEESYEKPLFTTYFKTVLFSIYLVAFAFWRPWQRQCVWRRRRLSVGVTHEEDSESTHVSWRHAPVLLLVYVCTVSRGWLVYCVI